MNGFCSELYTEDLGLFLALQHFVPRPQNPLSPGGVVSMLPCGMGGGVDHTQQENGAHHC